MTQADRAARIAAAQRPPQKPAAIYASADRSRLFAHLNVSERILSRGAFPFERRLFPTMLACIRSANRLAGGCLP